MAAGRSRCCGCNGRNARCSGCSCAASSTPCVSCRLLANGRCFNPFNPVDADRETDADNSPAARHSPGANVALSLNTAPLIQAASSLSQGSSPSDSSVGQSSLPSTLASRNSSAPDARGTPLCNSSAPAARATPAGPSQSSTASSAIPSSASSDLSQCYGSSTLPSLAHIMDLRVPVLRHVPKGARVQWASTLSDILLRVAEDPLVVESWKKLFMLPRCILYSPPRSSRSFWRDNARLVKQRLRSWKAGEFNELWIEVCKAFSNPRARNNHNPNDDLALCRSNAFRARRAIQDGQLHKALQFLASCGVTSVSDEVCAELLAKHPQSPPPPIPPFPTPDPLSVQDIIVQQCVSSFPTGTSPGPSGLRASHLLEALRCPPHFGSSFLQSLCKFVISLCFGSVAEEAVPFFCGAALTTLRKKAGGVRPIAVGEVQRRLISKCIAQSLSSEVAEILPPLQLGVGVKMECESIVHSPYSKLYIR